jgi:acetyl esterase/lipase
MTLPALLSRCLLALFLVTARAGSAETVADAAIEVRRDVAYLGSGRTERLDLYLPAHRSGLVPGVIWIHGGGWTKGDRAQARERNIGTTLASWGYAVASISYTLGNGAWPRNLHDVKNAVRFLRSQGAQYGIDGRRIVVAGGSAGGHLALLAGFTADRSFEPEAPYPGISSAVVAIIDFYGPTNHLSRVKANQDGSGTSIPHMGNAVDVFAGGDPANREALVASSPVTHVAAGLPPVLIVHGLGDSTVFHGQSSELAAALARAGVPHELILIPGVGHTFDLDKWNGRPLGFDLRGPVRAFLDGVTTER